MTPRGRRTEVAAAVLGALAFLTLLPTAAAADGVCDDLLVSHGPDGPSGDGRAVTITSQALERGVEGWTEVGWELAPGTTLRTIVVVGPHGRTELAHDARVAHGPVQELHFCGSSSTPGTPSPADEAATEPILAASTARGGPPTTGALTLGLLGASVGIVIGGVVLLLSRGSRYEHEVAR